jgi:hypothetical protein
MRAERVVMPLELLEPRDENDVDDTPTGPVIPRSPAMAADVRAAASLAARRVERRVPGP